MGEAKRRKKAAMAAMSQGIPSEILDDVVRRSHQNTLLALEHEDGLLNALIATFFHRNAALDMISSQNPPDLVACRAGCSACCHQMVACPPFEVFMIAQHLLAKRSDAELQRIIDRIHRLSKLPLTAEARYGKGVPCPLLEGDKCSVYDLRPSVCRSVFSQSKEQCDDALKHGGGDIGYLAYPTLMSNGMQLGIDAVLTKVSKLNTEQVELSGALLMALEDFDNLLDDWLGGGNPFSQWQLRRGPYPTNAELVSNVSDRLNL